MNSKVTDQEIEKLREEFKLYLQNIKPNWSSNTFSMHYSDSFYAYNNNIGENFWMYFVSDEGMMEARNNIYEYLVSNGKSGDPNVRANGYKISMGYFKDFLDQNYPGLAKEYSERASSQPSIWLFQGNPKYYDVIRAVDEVDIITWNVKKFQKQIKAGDKVYIWASGSGGGIVAKGTILDDPKMCDSDINDPYYVGEPLHKDPYLGVNIKIEQKLTSNIITRKVLLEDECTKGLEILTYPIGTNFRVTKEQDDVIESIISGTYKRVPVVTPISKATDKKRYWMYAPGEGSYMWEEFNNKGIMGIGWDELGDLSKYESKDSMKQKMKTLYGEEYSYKNAGHATWQFANEVKPGDIVFVKRGLKKIIGRGIVTSEYYFDSSRDTYRNVHNVNWTHTGEWDHEGQIVLKTLTDITPYTDYCKKLEDLIGSSSEEIIPIEDDRAQYEKYDEENFLSDVYLNSNRYNTLKSLLRKKKNIILQGPPGVGKTYVAERLAYSIMGEKDTSRVMVVQFHQS